MAADASGDSLAALETVCAWWMWRSSLRFSGDVLGRVALAFFIGVSVGNLLWLPYLGVLVIGVLPGAIIVAAPLALLLGFAAGYASDLIQKHLALSCILAVLVVTALYAAFDPPSDKAAVERLSLALTCGVASAIAFYVLTKRATA